MHHYPRVRTEEETLRRILGGASIARYGDGEFKHCADEENVSQVYVPALSVRLRQILIDSGSCMVGIPNLNPEDVARMPEDKAGRWPRYYYAKKWLNPTKVYASAFITRHDSALWINTAEYWQGVESLWLNKDVTLVRGSGKGLTFEDLVGAGTVTEILSRPQHAFEDYDALLERIGTPKRALLCLGPTATVLAVDLCKRGVQAIDLGHIALFLRKWRRGEAMTLTKDDKSHDKKAAVA